MRNKLFGLLTVIIMLGYLIGNYFVDYALERGADGSAPAACSKIADPSLTAPEPPTFEREFWTIESDDGLKLVADRFSPEQASDRWALLIHGYGRDRRFAYDYAEAYLERGWNVVVPDLRASGESEGTYITMGVRESDDLIDWIERIIAVEPTAKIILHGVSMGAATVMLASGKELPSNVRAAVEDCGYTSAYEMFTEQLEKIFGLPEVPIMPCVDIVSKLETGAAISEAAPIAAVVRTKIPMLFIHGDADRLIDHSMMERLYAASGAPVKEKWTVVGAGHASSKIINPTAYFDRVFGFLEAAVGK